jgi:hypothetical protein
VANRIDPFYFLRQKITSKKTNLCHPQIDSHPLLFFSLFPQMATKALVLQAKSSQERSKARMVDDECHQKFIKGPADKKAKKATRGTYQAEFVVDLKRRLNKTLKHSTLPLCEKNIIWDQVVGPSIDTISDPNLLMTKLGELQKALAAAEEKQDTNTNKEGPTVGQEKASEAPSVSKADHLLVRDVSPWLPNMDVKSDSWTTQCLSELKTFETHQLLGIAHWLVSCRASRQVGQYALQYQNKLAHIAKEINLKEWYPKQVSAFPKSTHSQFAVSKTNLSEVVTRSLDRMAVDHTNLKFSNVSRQVILGLLANQSSLTEVTSALCDLCEEGTQILCKINSAQVRASIAGLLILYIESELWLLH